MKLSVKIVDIANRGAMLNQQDARHIGVLDGDRILIQNEVNGTSVQVHLDTTATLMPPGTIGIYRPANTPLSAEEGAAVEVREAGSP